MTHNPRLRKHNHYIPATELKRLARGRWREILVAAGIPVHALDGRKGRPCPRCGGRDRFSPMRGLDERGAVLCRHCHHASTHPKCGDGIATLAWWLGVDIGAALAWLTSFLGVSRGHHAPRIMRPIEKEVAIPKPEVDSLHFAKMSEAMRSSMSTIALDHCAGLLGLPIDPLVRLCVGWSSFHRATSWPMRDADGNVIGIRLRCPETARKWAVTGSRAGLIFDPDSMREQRGGRVWVVEGPTDTAALLSIGIDAVGVPSAGGSCELLVDLARRMRPEQLVIVADADDAGRHGAERIRDAVVIVAPVRMINTPSGIKDVRAWVCAGADRMTVEQAANGSPVCRIELQGGAS